MSSLILLQGRPYHNFINSIKSEETKQEYKRSLLRYLSHYKTNLGGILSNAIPDIENMLVDYLLDLKKQDLSSSYINLNFCALKHFYFMNDVRINKEKIAKFLGEPKKKNVDRSYTHPEIKSMLDIADLRFKVVISVLASAGIRIGALSPLKLSHLQKKKNHGIYKFIIYENTKDEYFTFCSPECSCYIDSYLEYRSRSGERLGPNSYLIREQFDINDFEQIRKEGRPISKDSISNILHSLTIKAGLRTVNHNARGKERKSVPLVHGFRKFYTTQLINAKVNPEIREMTLGHSIGLATAYYKPTEDEMLDEYMKAADNLTINEENRLKRKVEKLEVEASQLQRLQAAVQRIEAKMKSAPNVTYL